MVRIGLLGVGRWGTNIKRTLEEIGGVSVVATDSPREARSLERTDLNGVIIATPGSTHAELALPFIRQGLPTFIEKPLTTSVRDAKRLEREAQKHGTQVMVGHLHLYNPAYVKTKELVGKIGRLRAITFESANNGPFRDDVSVLWDWGPHDVAMALDLVGSRPKRVQAWGVKALRPRTALYDTVLVKLSFDRGLNVLISNSWLSPEKRKKTTAIGEKHTVVFDDTADQKIAFYGDMGPKSRRQHMTIQSPRVSHPRYSQKSPLETEMRAFLQMVKTNKTPPTPLRQGSEVVQVLAAAEKSLALDGKEITY